MEDLDQGNVAESLLESKEEINDSSDDERFKEDISRKHKDVALKDIYSVALELKENIRTHSRSWYQNWPPLSTGSVRIWFTTAPKAEIKPEIVSSGNRSKTNIWMF